MRFVSDIFLEKKFSKALIVIRNKIGPVFSNVVQKFWRFWPENSPQNIFFSHFAIFLKIWFQTISTKIEVFPIFPIVFYTNLPENIKAVIAIWAPNYFDLKICTDHLYIVPNHPAKAQGGWINSALKWQDTEGCAPDRFMSMSNTHVY